MFTVLVHAATPRITEVLCFCPSVNTTLARGALLGSGESSALPPKGYKKVSVKIPHALPELIGNEKIQ